MRVCLKYLRFRLFFSLSVIRRMTIRSILEKNANIYLLPKLTELQFGTPQICQIAIGLITLKLKCKWKLSYSECTLLYVLQITLVSVADLHSKILDAPPSPRGSKFFQFHAVFGKFWQNCMLAPPWGVGAPSSGKS